MQQTKVFENYSKFLEHKKYDESGFNGISQDLYNLIEQNNTEIINDAGYSSKEELENIIKNNCIAWNTAIDNMYKDAGLTASDELKNFKLTASIDESAENKYTISYNSLNNLFNNLLSIDFINYVLNGEEKTLYGFQPYGPNSFNFYGYAVRNNGTHFSFKTSVYLEYDSELPELPPFISVGLPSYSSDTYSNEIMKEAGVEDGEELSLYIVGFKEDDSEESSFHYYENDLNDSLTPLLKYIFNNIITDSNYIDNLDSTNTNCWNVLGENNINCNIFTDVDKTAQTQQEIYKYTLTNCINCENCINYCTNCNHCINCENCVNCKDCENCQFCKNCKNCHKCHGYGNERTTMYCEECVNCINCFSDTANSNSTQYLINCISCEDCCVCENCSNCENCQSCEECNNCKNCSTCYDCEWCDGLEEKQGYYKTHWRKKDYLIDNTSSNNSENSNDNSR